MRYSYRLVHVDVRWLDVPNAHVGLLGRRRVQLHVVRVGRVLQQLMVGFVRRVRSRSRVRRDLRLIVPEEQSSAGVVTVAKITAAAVAAAAAAAVAVLTCQAPPPKTLFPPLRPPQWA